MRGGKSKLAPQVCHARTFLVRARARTHTRNHCQMRSRLGFTVLNAQTTAYFLPRDSSNDRVNVSVSTGRFFSFLFFLLPPFLFLRPRADSVVKKGAIV